MTRNVGIISSEVLCLKWCSINNNILNCFFNNSYNKFGLKVFFHSYENANKKWKNKNKYKNYILLVKKNELHNKAHIGYKTNWEISKKHTSLIPNKYCVNFTSQTNKLFSNNKIVHKLKDRKHVGQDDEEKKEGNDENVIRINNLCTKIYDIGKNGVKNKEEWIRYLIEYCKEEENHKFIKIKQMFMLLIGLSKLKGKINSVHYKVGYENGEKNKVVKISDIVDRHIEVLSKKVNEMTDKQLSIFLYILERWKKMEKYKEIVNIINDKILKKTTFKKLNVRSFCNVLHIYSKKCKVDGNYINEEKKNDMINIQINKFITKLSKSKCSVEDMLFFLSSIDKLKIKIKEKEMIEHVVKIINDNIQEDTNYFIIPSLLLYLSNLNIYNEGLYLKLKNIILENYYFYNSIHITNIFYAFSKFKPDFVHELFDTLSNYIIQTFLKEKEKDSKTMNEYNRAILKNTQINKNKFLKYDESMFNIFQITNIINSCIKCDYINYNFFHDLILSSETVQEHSLDNLINFFKSISNILKTFNVHMYKYVIYFYTNEKVDPKETETNTHNYKESIGNGENFTSEKEVVYLYSLMENQTYYKKVYEYFTNRYMMKNSFFIEQYNTFGGVENDKKVKESDYTEKSNIRLMNSFNKMRDNVAEQIRIIIENNLYDKNVQYILHNLMIFMYQSEVKYVNLYTLCISILEKNLFFFSINNLYLYIKIFNKAQIYNYEILHNIFEYIYNHFDQFELRKKVKIVLLSYDIFKKINEHQMELLTNFFLDNMKFNEENKNNMSKYYQINNKHKINNSCDITPKWLLPTSTELKQNVLNMKQKSPTSLYDDISNLDDNEICLRDFLNNKMDVESTKINEYQYFSLTNNDQVFFKKVEQTEVYPFNLDFNEYIKFLLILIHDVSNKILDNRTDDKNCVNISLIPFISKNEHNLIKIKNEDPVLERYSELVKQNLNKRKNLIIKIFSKIADMIENEKKIKMNKTDLYIDQVLYILYFIKLMDEDLYSSIIKIEQIKKIKTNEKIKKGDNDMEDPKYANMFGSTLFELKKEDMEFIGLENEKKNNEYEIGCDNLFLYEDKINYRYKYKSVNDSIKNVINNLKKIKFNDIAKFDDSNKFSFKKMNKFYKLDTYINIDILFTLEKNGENFYNCLIFYPYELKKIITNIKNNKITFTHSYDESFSFCTEILCIYNFIKKKNQTNFSFTILDTTSFVNFSEWTYENVEINKTIKLVEKKQPIDPLFNQDLNFQKSKKLLEEITSL
ncbi:conserved Plasmodium protein, unknown function [Plasmodium vinckei vinckei]|uniref:Uncharacterized protein n=1 Tax=Plasmodium vinckei vinckei TaxID=54757 RepID=A0A449BN22_PLAVN|nr:conserved Plasmodium protein, unknown function [Plasmodium vinckei vinckei]VEV54812.1 conserved Plasmodium protein, unknown function [Plasmodium vinckei vinckei]